MTKHEQRAASLAQAVGEAIQNTWLGDMIRARFVALYGKCGSCDKPLGGPSPSKLCEPCHANVLLSNLGAASEADA